MRPSVLDGPGAMHIDRIANDCLARPLPRRLGAARARLNLINSILKENQ